MQRKISLECQVVLCTVSMIERNIQIISETCRNLIAPIVIVVSRVSGNILPLDIFAICDENQFLPEVLIEYRFLGSSSPASHLPTFDPQRNTLHHILRAGKDNNLR